MRILRHACRAFAHVSDNARFTICPQLKTETAAFREAREQDLSKYMSRMEIMSRLDKRMREGTAMALLEARKAFEERKAQGRISTRAVAPAITDSRFV